jgi:hypothetical protein
MTLKKGERQYNDRVEDVTVLKVEIRNLRCRVRVLQKSNEALDDLRLVSAPTSRFRIVAESFVNFVIITIL